MNAKLAFIAAHAAEHAVRLMCRVLSVSPSWFHAWRAAAPDRAARQAAQDVMVAQGERIARKAVAGLMKQNDVRPLRRGRRVPRTTDSRHKLGIAPNLLARNFKVETPDAVWLADISHAPADEGWLHLAAVKDLATMEVVGWSMSDRLKGSLAIDAMRMAMQNRRPRPGLIRRSDRGAQCACGDHRRLLKAHGARASMSGKV